MTKTRNKRNKRSNTKKRGGGYFGDAQPYEMRSSDVGNNPLGPLISGATTEKLTENTPYIIGGIAAVVLGVIFVPKLLR